MTHRIALIHPLQPAMRAAGEAFARHWPEARCINILDDSLPADLAREGATAPSLYKRIQDLIRYAMELQVSGILFTGSGFGPVIEELAPTLAIPLLKPNQAMFEDAFRIGKRIGMLVSFPAAADAMRQDFESAAKAAGALATLEIAAVPQAFAQLQAGNAEAHNRLLANAARGLAQCDAILLAQFSTAQAEPTVAAAVPRPVLTSPGSAVKKLRKLVEARGVTNR